MDNDRSAEKVFVEDVPAIYEFLVTDFGFELKQENPYTFHAVSPHCFVLIGSDTPSVYIALRPPYERKIYEPDTKLIGFAWIMEAFHPDLHYSEAWIKSGEQMKDELERQANLLKTYCSDFLSGDFSRWPQVVDYVAANKSKK